MLIVRDLNNLFQQMSGFLINSKGGQNMLRKAGINANSGQYKSVISDMNNACHGGIAYTNVQAIKNRMRSYDKDGDRINGAFGVSGLMVNEGNRASKNRIIPISEDIRDEMFELTKKEFLKEKGVQNGERTKRSDVYRKLYQNTKKNDRLAAGHTLHEYEEQYLQAFVDAVKAVDKDWRPGKSIPSGALDHIKREEIESQLMANGGSFVRKSADVKL